MMPIQSIYIKPEIATLNFCRGASCLDSLSISSFSIVNDVCFEVFTAVTVNTVLGWDAVSSGRRMDVSQEPSASTRP
jgi:hypothetical protein